MQCQISRLRLSILWSTKIQVIFSYVHCIINWARLAITYVHTSDNIREKLYNTIVYRHSIIGATQYNIYTKVQQNLNY